MTILVKSIFFPFSFNFFNPGVSINLIPIFLSCPSIVLSNKYSVIFLVIDFGSGLYKDTNFLDNKLINVLLPDLEIPTTSILI